MKSVVFKLIRFTGLPWLFRETVQCRRVSIFMFHDMKAEDAARAFPWLKKHYNLVSLRDYLQAVETGGRLPRKSAILTFDDGHIGNYALLPLIRRDRIPVTIFLCSEIIGTHRHFWFDHNEAVIGERERLKKLPNPLRLEALASLGFLEEQEYAERHALTRDQIQEMRPWVDFQAHTCFHPCLTQCDDETARREIVHSKEQLERDYSLDIYAIAYPNGDYSDRDIRLAREAGYRCGVTVDSGYNAMDTDLFRLKRISVNDARSLDELIVKSSGWYSFIKQYLRRI